MKRPIFAVMLILSPSNAFADKIEMSCEFLRAGENIETAEILMLEPDGAVMNCKPARYDTSKIKYIASKIEKGQQGTCRYVIRRAFRTGLESGAAAWRYETPAERQSPYDNTLMAKATGPCPSYSDPSYMPAGNIEEEVFLTLTEFWEKASSSKSNFDAAFSTLPIFESFTNGFIKLEKALDAGWELKIQSISPTFSNRRRVTGEYELYIEGGNTCG